MGGGERKIGKTDASAVRFTGVFPAWQLSRLWKRESWEQGRGKRGQELQMLNLGFAQFEERAFHKWQTIQEPGERGQCVLMNWCHKGEDCFLPTHCTRRAIKTIAAGNLSVEAGIPTVIPLLG